MTKQLILAIDQGTSSTKALLVDESLTPVASASVAISISSPKPGWVQQDAAEIMSSVNFVIAELVEAAKQNTDWQIIGLALTNQRESALAWNSATGAPLGPMLGWQDRRTEPQLAKFNDSTKAQIREITGLGLDPMFSALKLQWLLDEYDADRVRSGSGQIMLGTVDAYIRFCLTGEQVVEVGNASRTQLLDIANGQWSASLCELFNIPIAALPNISMSDAESEAVLDGPAKGLKILATLADSHAALYAHGLASNQDINAKATFGTGSSIMAAGKFTLDSGRIAEAGLVSTIAWGLRESGITHGVEGNIISSGSTLVWLAELLAKSVGELAALAEATEDSAGVDLVPAFSGLGAPWWRSGVAGQISGLTMASGSAQLSLAAFEAIVLQIEDVVTALEAALGASLTSLNVDGGPTSNGWLVQLLANLSQRKIIRTDVAELSAVGVAALAGAKIWMATTSATEFTPKLEPQLAKARRNRWDAAVKQVLDSATN